jgi:hypothetical protein
MEAFKVIKLLEQVNEKHENYDGHEEGADYYYVVVQSPSNELFFFTGENWVGSCGSGYCAASGGDIDGTLKPIKSELPQHKYEFVAIGEHFIDVVNGKVRMSVLDNVDENGEYYVEDATVSSVKSIDGIEIISSTGNGGCNYYPSGSCSFNTRIFKRKEV